MSMISGRKARGGGSRAPGAVPVTGARTTSRARWTAVRVLPVAAAAGMVALAVPAAAPAAVSHARPATAVPDISRPILVGKQIPAPLTTTQCLAQIGINCYTPVQYRTAYNLNRLYARGVTGRGRTIVIVDSFGSPTIRHDIKVFDKQFGFPNPNLKVLKFGNVPPFDPNNETQVGWAEETTLDVEYAHSIAPHGRDRGRDRPPGDDERRAGAHQRGRG
jgi:hypothetical protein